MKNHVDSKCIDISLIVGDWVFLSLQPFYQLSLHRQPTHKLSKRFLEPFQILEKIGPIAYNLAFPSTTQLHEVFHDSKLKYCIGDPHIQQLPLPNQCHYQC